ncbi:YhcN/YlaJ family sporulation lipoprotein [Virgibacillus sp. MSJ-26]|uniref:YhcN/YlaJ family sporulation lipoprotein n=1 Tax=Virgibacillus sp. MSJ-26 TaxID=2841522 RepID=UPI001C101044|nr:YhcN/YlaJ family sporulation lipoprotein [Virgibacillus sp. MSJ-26]
MLKRLFLILLPVLLLFACQQENNEGTLSDQETTDRYVKLKNSNQDEKKELSNSQIANHLVDVADSVPDVNNSVAIVLGPYAVVGLNVDGDLDRSRVGTIKYSVLEALKKDPYGKTAVVVADGDIADRISEMNKKVQEGYPVQGIIEELAAIVGRYMPNFPVPENMPKEEDQNKEILPEDDKENLEDIQENQSNDELDNKR